MTWILRRVVQHGVALAAAAVLVLPAAAQAPTDADFLAAKAAFERGDNARLDALAPRLAGHLLTPYVTYWQIRSRIDDADSETVRAYLAQYPGTPLADRLRIDWLKALGKRGDWTRFALDYPPATGEDVELTCYGIQYRRQRDGDAALAAAKPLWFTAQATPDACDPLFAALFASGELTTADRLARFRLAVEAGNLRLAQALAVMPGGAAIVSLKDMAAVERDPARALAKGEFKWRTPSGQTLALYALERAARKDAGAARAGWVRWRPLMPLEARQYGNARLAYHGARQLEPLANEWYREAGTAPLAVEPQEWRVRAALRALEWRDVRAAIDALPDAERQAAAWRYWKARALAALDERADAEALYATLADDLDFYGLLAGEALGRGEERFAALRSASAQPSAEAIEAFGARAEVKRAVKLASLDMRAESRREWASAVRGLDDASLLLAAEYARRVGLYDRAINTAERTSTRHDFRLRYLTPYRDAFGAAARDQEIDEELLFAIARQESRFVSDIVSSAGAVGLMQLMPATARWVAQRLARSDYSSGQISQVELNTQFGAYYFKYWHERLDRMPALAAAAYNAGPRRAQAWRPPTGSLEGAIWVETIPFSETRDYVKKVLANAMLYTYALGRPYVPLTTRLGTVLPRGANGGEQTSTN